MSALEEIAAERRRQIEVEGWTTEHDDSHVNGEMADAAACYAAGENLGHFRSGRSWAWLWPWDRKGWGIESRRRDLAKAAALIVAEIERLDRKGPAHER